MGGNGHFCPLLPQPQITSLWLTRHMGYPAGDLSVPEGGWHTNCTVCLGHQLPAPSPGVPLHGHGMYLCKTGNYAKGYILNKKTKFYHWLEMQSFFHVKTLDGL